jgi:hypothetical protein
VSNVATTSFDIPTAGQRSCQCMLAKRLDLDSWQAFLRDIKTTRERLHKLLLGRSPGPTRRAVLQPT